MAEIDEVKERIGWLKVLFGLTAAINASLLSWLLTDLAEKHPDLSERLLSYWEELDVWHVGAFLVLMASPLMSFIPMRMKRFGKKAFFFCLVVVVDFFLLFYLIMNLPNPPYLRALDLWHVGALFMTAILSLILLIGMWEINYLIRRLGELK